MQAAYSGEDHAIRKLIAQIDDIDRWRDRIGRRLIALFLAVFAVALAMLFYAVTYAHPQPGLQHPGPRVPGVLHGVRDRTTPPSSNR